MSYPKIDNTVKSALTDLKEIVVRNQAENEEVQNLVSDIEKSISKIETKANRLAKLAKRRKKADTNIAVPANQITSTIPAI